MLQTKHGEISSVTVLGRRWTSRAGTTYHSAQILVNGETVANTGQHSGYGEGYIQTACTWLESNGYMPDREHHDNGSAEAPWLYFRDDRGVAWNAQAIDVSRERDL